MVSRLILTPNSFARAQKILKGKRKTERGAVEYKGRRQHEKKRAF